MVLSILPYMSIRHGLLLLYLDIFPSKYRSLHYLVSRLSCINLPLLLDCLYSLIIVLCLYIIIYLPSYILLSLDYHYNIIYFFGHYYQFNIIYSSLLILLYSLLYLPYRILYFYTLFSFRFLMLFSGGDGVYCKKKIIYQIVNKINFTT